MFLERLPTSVQTVLTYGSDDLDISKLTEMADRMMKVELLSSTTVAQVSQPLTASTSDLAELNTLIAQLSAAVAALQLRLSAGPSRRSFSHDKPLPFALHFRSDKLNPREIRHLEYISQFTSDIRHIDGSRDEVADALPRPYTAHSQLSPGIDLAEMAAEQRRVDSPCDEDVSGATTDNWQRYHSVRRVHPIPSSICAIIFPPQNFLLLLGVELQTSWFPTSSSGLGFTRTSKHGHGLVSPVNELCPHPDDSLLPGCQRDGRAVSRHFKTSLRAADDPEN
ncbi:hypothetical protein SprV_0301095700 [Sparganum proliferum]